MEEALTASVVVQGITFGPFWTILAFIFGAFFVYTTLRVLFSKSKT